MGLLTHRRPQLLAKYMLFALTVVLAAATLAVVASGGNSKSYADGQGSPPECLEDLPNVDGSVSPADAADGVQAPAGNVVLAVCIKAGNPHSGPLTVDGFYDANFNLLPSSTGACFEVAGVGTQEVTVTDVAAPGTCQGAGLSHIDVIFGPPPPPNGNGTTTTTTPPQRVTPPPAPQAAPPRIVVGAAPFTG
jgi:hypothetical protein